MYISNEYIYIVFCFRLHNCSLLIPLYNTAVLMNICRFLINVVVAYFNKVDQKTTYIHENCRIIYIYV